MSDVISRRRLLIGTAAGSIGMTALAVPRPAGAFSTEYIAPSSPLGLAYSSRCGPASEHAVIRASLYSRLASQSAASGATVSASEVCPICGCPIYVTRKAD